MRKSTKFPFSHSRLVHHILKNQPFERDYKKNEDLNSMVGGILRISPTDVGALKTNERFSLQWLYHLHKR